MGTPSARDDWRSAKAWVTGRQFRVLPTWISDLIATWRLVKAISKHELPDHSTGGAVIANKADKSGTLAAGTQVAASDSSRDDDSGKTAHDAAFDDTNHDDSLADMHLNLAFLCARLPAIVFLRRSRGDVVWEHFSKVEEPLRRAVCVDPP
jgi:hypothetical protein